MRWGLSFPNFGGYAEPGVLVELAVRAESAGWDGFFVWDHIVIADGMPVADPWVVLGAMAQATKRIAIGPMVTAMPRHRPWVVARQAVSLDRLSGGRMVLGVGIGSDPREEFGTFGGPTDARVRADMLDEGLDIIEGVWSGRPFGYDGTHYIVREMSFGPPPVRLPRIPIWVAGMLPHRRPLRRAARYDGVFPIREDMAEMTVDDFIEMRTYVESHRTSDEPFDYVIGWGTRTRDEFEALEQAGVTWYMGAPSPQGESIEETMDWVGAGPEIYTV